MPDEGIDFDAIVVGTGVSGGWVAKELTEAGLKTLVLDRGRMVRHGDYPTAMLNPWELPYGNLPTRDEVSRQPILAAAGFATQASKHWFVDEIDHPYLQKQPFTWIRGYQVGGRSITWGRQSYRWSEMDFAANGREGVGIDWPIRYRDIEPWYDHVEAFIGVSGQAEGLAQLPDGKFLPPMELNCVETHLKSTAAAKFGRTVTIGRTAHLTAPLGHSPQRALCQYRNLCSRGCPYGAYFSSNSSTLPAAEQTGKMVLRPNTLVYEVIYDAKTQRATGVRALDAQTRKQLEFRARVVFLCASTFGTLSILLNSVSSRFPQGLGNDSGELGCNLLDHHMPVAVRSIVQGFEDRYYTGRRPNGLYIPRFVNIGSDRRDYLRGFGYQGGAVRTGWERLSADPALGADLKAKASEPGPWLVTLAAFGEILPNHDNRVTLERAKRDAYGLPVLAFDARLRDNELRMRADMGMEAAQMLEAAGFRDPEILDMGYSFGRAIHEMGGARMGRDPATSVVNEWNQVHACKNVYVTDGACMTSSACQNPSLTYMALSARAARHAVDELRKLNL